MVVKKTNHRSGADRRPVNDRRPIHWAAYKDCITCIGCCQLTFDPTQSPALARTVGAFVFDFCVSWAILPLTLPQGGASRWVAVVVGEAEMALALCYYLSENDESAKRQF